jgi:hypothetical protein
MMTPEMTLEMMTPELNSHQIKDNKILYLLFVSLINEFTKATQFIDLFGEDGGSSFNGEPPMIVLDSGFIRLFEEISIIGG